MKSIPCSSCSRPVPVSESCTRTTCARCVARAMCPPPPPAPTTEGQKLPSPSPAIRTAVHLCANFITGLHQADRPCSALQGQRCSWYEQAVLPSATVPAIADYQERYIKNRTEKIDSGKHCACGAPVPAGKHLCQKCRIENRKEAWKNANERKKHAKA